MQAPSLPRFLLRSLGRFLSILWAGLVLVSVGVVLLLAALWLLLPRLNEYGPDLERGLSGLLGESVTIGAVETYWEGWTPVLRLEEVRILGPNQEAPLLEFEQARITVDPVATVAAGSLRAQSVTITGASLLLLGEPDGGIAIAGRPRAPAEGPRRLDTAFTLALLAQKNLELKSATVRWRAPGPAGATYTFEEINLRLENTSGGHYLEGSLRPPGSGPGGSPVVYIMEITGDVTGPAWTAQAYVRGKNLDMSALPLARRLPGIERVSGRASFDLRAEFSGFELRTLRGNLSVREARFSWPGGAVALAAARSAVTLRRPDAGWTVELDRLVADTGLGPWPETRGSVTWQPATAAGPARLTAAFDRASIRHLRPLASPLLDRARREWLSSVDPDAELRSLEATLELAGGGAARYRVSAEVLGLDTRPAGMLPAIEGLNGRVELTPDGGRAELRPGPVRVRNESLFKAPFVLESVAGTVTWRAVDGSVRLETGDLALVTGDVSLRIDGALAWPPAGQSPELDLRLRAAGGDVRSLVAILPRPYVRPKVAAWLDRAILAGHLQAAELTMRGPLAKLRLGDDSVQFLARAQVSGLKLKYGRRWPVAEGVSGELTVRGRALTATARAGTVFDTRIRRLEVTIDDLFVRPAKLKLSGRFAGPTEDTFRYLEASPLAARYRQSLDQVEVTGESELELEVELPIGRRATRVEGSVTLRANTLVGKGLNVRIDHASGVVRFNRLGLSAKRIEGRYLGAPVWLDVSRQRGRATRIWLAGEADPPFIARQLRRLRLLGPGDDPETALPRVTGQTPWRAEVVLPNTGAAAPAGRTLTVRASLDGLALDLPAPFGKPAGTARALVIATDLADRERRTVRIRYGDGVGALLEMRFAAGAWSLTRGRVRVGETEVEPPDAPGLEVSGNLDLVPVDDWLELILGSGPIREEAKRTTAAKTRPPWYRSLREIDLTTSTLGWMGRRLAASDFKATRGLDGTWRIDIDGKEVRGAVQVPAAGTGQPVVAEFDYLRLSPEEPPARDFDPRRLPQSTVVIKRLTLGDRAVGRMEFLVIPDLDGVRFGDLRVDAPNARMTGSGRWVLRNGRDWTQLSFVGKTESLGDLLAAYGYGDGTVAGGETTVTAELGWSGRPTDFDAEKVLGTIHFRAANGRLLGLRPGITGRAFSLLSVPALRQRLRLDFSDIFGKGLHFEVVDGSFTLADGNAYTNNVILDGPSVRIEVAGRVGLVAEDYDQTVTITPKLSTSLPLVPIWLAEKVMGKKVFDRSFASQYTVTGSWANPTVTRVRTFEDDETAAEEEEQ